VRQCAHGLFCAWQRKYHLWRAGAQRPQDIMARPAGSELPGHVGMSKAERSEFAGVAAKLSGVVGSYTYAVGTVAPTAVESSEGTSELVRWRPAVLHPHARTHTCTD
jgi:hypothetical protein